MELKRILMALIIGFSSFTYLSAQDEDLDNMEFENAPEPEESLTYFAVGGGYIGDFSFFNLDKLDPLLENMNLVPGDFKSTIYLQGAHGFVHMGMLKIPFLKDLRIGVVGLGGASNLETKFGDTTHGFNFDVGMTGVSIDYPFVLFRKFAVLVGVTGGWGEINIEAYKSPKNGKWPDFSPTAGNNSYFQRATAPLTFIRPNLYLEYAVVPLVMVRANVGYNMTFMGDWKLNRTTSLESSTVPDINGNGLSVQLGLFVGIFNY